MVCPWRRFPTITWKFPLCGRYCLQATEFSNRLCTIPELGPMCLALVFSWRSSGRRSPDLENGKKKTTTGSEGSRMRELGGKRGHVGAAESEESQPKPKTRHQCCFYFGARVSRLKPEKENKSPVEWAHWAGWGLSPSACVECQLRTGTWALSQAWHCLYLVGL